MRLGGNSYIYISWNISVSELLGGKVRVGQLAAHHFAQPFDAFGLRQAGQIRKSEKKELISQENEKAAVIIKLIDTNPLLGISSSETVL